MPRIHQRHRQRDGQTDGRTTYDSNTALALRAWRGKNRSTFAKVIAEINLGGPFLPARRYASAGLCDSDVSVCPSVCPPRAGIVPSRAEAGS